MPYNKKVGECVYITSLPMFNQFLRLPYGVT